MKKIICLALLSMLVAPVSFAQDRYISDNLFTYMHKGPSNQFRIIGSVNAGEKVTLVTTDKDSKYSQIVDSKGRKGWVESKYVSSQPSIAERMPALEKELKEVKEKLLNARKNSDDEKSDLIESLESRNEQIKELEKNHVNMNKKLTTSQQEVRELRAKLDTQKEDLLLKYFTYGGGVAGIGLIFGLLLPHLIPRKKKSPSGWA